MANRLEEILTTFKDIHQITEGVVQVADDSFDLAQTEGRCLNRAITQYSVDCPRRRVVRFTGTEGTYLYLLTTLVSSWGDGYVVDRVQFPLDSQEELFIDRNAWAETIDPATEAPALRFHRNEPTAQAALWFLCPHTITTSTSTIPLKHEEAIANYAAHLILEVVANKTSVFSTKGAFQTDGVDYSDISARYRTASDRALQRYNDIIGKNQPIYAPNFVDLDVDSPYGYRPFHPEEFH